MAKIKLGQIKGIDLVKNSKNKLSTHLPEVRRGCGAHGQNGYNRNKEKRIARKEMNRSDSFFMAVC